jgi:hypothetical protein
MSLDQDVRVVVLLENLGELHQFGLRLRSQIRPIDVECAQF